MPNLFKIVGIPACIFIVPIVLQALYISFMRGESIPSSFLHWSYDVLIMASALPFIAMLRTSPGFRIAIAILLLPVIVIVTLISGVLTACFVFHSCP